MTSKQGEGSGLEYHTINRLGKAVLIVLTVFVILNVALATVTNVSTDVTASDRQAFTSTLGLERPRHSLTFDEEIALIRSFQRQVLKAAPLGAPIPEFQEREPEHLLRQGSGLCYDRSRTLDKLYSWAGFQSRHIYIIYLKDPHTGAKISLPKALLTKNVSSHAVTEVKTQRGWLLVDSNSEWISLNTRNKPVNADHLHVKHEEFSNIPPYFKEEYIAIRGLYSRRGQFFKPNIPYPELNWPDFIRWLLEPTP